jgi:tRNA A-37 threonylcarbamoyl transferase component Bud32
MPDSDQPNQPAQPISAASRSPSASRYLPEMPSAENLQVMLEGHYLVESVLAQGGMAAVYKGVHLGMNCPVAIKLLPRHLPGVDDDLAYEQRFKREGHVMAELTHPNIVQMYECGDVGEDFLFIGMELMEGGDLSSAIKGGMVTPKVALSLIGPICGGLQVAHERGLVHRDIKPANIFLTAKAEPKLADFGLAKMFDATSTFVTQSGLGIGTPDYAAPEQFEGRSDIDHRADIYSLGVMFYQMLTGSLPRGSFKPPSHHVAIDPRFDWVVAKAMAPDRNERYQSVKEMNAEVQRILATPGVQARAHSSRNWTTARQVPPMPTRTAAASAKSLEVYETLLPSWKSQAGMLAGVLVLIAAIGAGAWFAFQKWKPAAATGNVATMTLGTAVPPLEGKWVNALAEWWAAPGHQDFSKESDGAARSSRNVNPMEAVALKTPLVDQAVRVTARGDRWDVNVRHSRAATDGARMFYNAKIVHNGVEFGIVSKGYTVLKTFPLPANFDRKATHTLEVRAIGETFTVLLDDLKLGEVSSGRITSGNPMVSADKDAVIERFEYLDLGGAAQEGTATAPAAGPPATPATAEPPKPGEDAKHRGAISR